jgi:GrpB-like predicted nucleotidyltransferase (UPF0157 family)
MITHPKPEWPDQRYLETVLIGGIEKVAIKLADYDPNWVNLFEQHASRIRTALKETALHIEHIGSTSVPELAAKPIIDILVVVANSADETAYLPALIAAGYVLRVREPDFDEHRMLRTPTRDVHVHVYSLGSAEIERNLLFRDALRKHPAERERYERVKRDLAARDWPDMNAYADAKTQVIEEIITRAKQEKSTRANGA